MNVRSNSSNYVDENGTPMLKQSIAVYMDFLGYTERIAESFKQGRGQEELIKLRSALDQAYQFLKPRAPEDSLYCVDEPLFQIRSFSDNVVLAYAVPDPERCFSSFGLVVDAISYVQVELARQGYFLRGAISFGDLYVGEDLIFGPALVEAVVAEERLAINPRIILCKSAQARFEAACGGWVHTQKAPYFLMDSDDIPFLDYLDQAIMVDEQGPYIEFLTVHKVQVLANLEKFKNNPKVRSKYEWAAHYHNMVCERYRDAIEPFQDEDDGFWIDSTQISSYPQLWWIKGWDDAVG